MGKFADAIGIWELKLGGLDLELKPKMNHVRKFRNILVDDNNRKDKNALYDKIAEFMFQLIKEHYQDENDDDIKEWIEININPVFEEAMIAFRWSTREEMLKQKQMGIEELKKQMSSV